MERRAADARCVCCTATLYSEHPHFILTAECICRMHRATSHKGSQMKTICRILVVSMILQIVALGQSGSSEFHEPWKDPTKAIVLDSFWKNKLDLSALAEDSRVAGIIHKASEGFTADRKYTERKAEALRRGYKWGSYHLGRPGDPVKQADFYLKTAQPGDDEVLALDLEDTSSRDMNLRNAQRFIKHIREKTGRYPLLYVTDRVRRSILANYGTDSVFAKTPLWYARVCQDINCYFPNTLWSSYTLWQFASEQNCPSKTNAKRRCAPQVCPLNECPLLAPVPGTDFEMDVNIFNGTVEELRSKWPFIVR